MLWRGQSVGFPSDLDMVEILDVGCGDRPRGTVNLDFGDYGDLYQRNQLNPSKIKNFVRGDAHHLPFRDNIFVEVRCWHTLEHLTGPALALSEMVRVANGVVKVVVPYRYHEMVQNFFLPQRKAWAKKHHRHYFDKRQLQQILAKLGLKGKVSYRMKFSDAIKNVSDYHLSFWEFVLFGVLEAFLPPTPGELMVTIDKKMNPRAFAR